MKLLDAAIKGHDAVQKQLFSAFVKKRLPHALLFSGPSGVGKKQMAWALAQTLLCQKSFPACGQCPSCRQIQKRVNPSVLLIFPETLRIRIHEVETVSKFLALRSQTLAQIVIIDEAHLLNLQAANSLLKIIEEPPDNSYFVLISSLPSKLPLTVSSRLQKIRFQILSEEIVKELVPEAEDWMIRAAQGRIDRLQQLQDKSELRKFALKLWIQVAENKNPLALNFPPEIKDRKTALFTVRCWQQLLRDSRFVQTGEKALLIHEDQRDLLIEKISAFPKGKVDVLIEEALELEASINSYRDTLLCFEHFALTLHSF